MQRAIGGSSAKCNWGRKRQMQGGVDAKCNCGRKCKAEGGVSARKRNWRCKCKVQLGAKVQSAIGGVKCIQLERRRCKVPLEMCKYSVQVGT